MEVQDKEVSKPSTNSWLQLAFTGLPSIAKKEFKVR